MNRNFFRRIAGGTAGGFLLALSAPLYVYALENADDASSGMGMVMILLAVGIGMMLSVWQQNRKKK